MRDSVKRSSFQCTWKASWYPRFRIRKPTENKWIVLQQIMNAIVKENPHWNLPIFQHGAKRTSVQQSIQIKTISIWSLNSFWIFLPFAGQHLVGQEGMGKKQQCGIRTVFLQCNCVVTRPILVQLQSEQEPVLIPFASADQLSPSAPSSNWNKTKRESTQATRSPLFVVVSVLSLSTVSNFGWYHPNTRPLFTLVAWCKIVFLSKLVRRYKFPAKTSLKQKVSPCRQPRQSSQRLQDYQQLRRTQQKLPGCRIQWLFSFYGPFLAVCEGHKPWTWISQPVYRKWITCFLNTYQLFTNSWNSSEKYLLGNVGGGWNTRDALQSKLTPEDAHGKTNAKHYLETLLFSSVKPWNILLSVCMKVLFPEYFFPRTNVVINLNPFPNIFIIQVANSFFFSSGKEKSEMFAHILICVRHSIREVQHTT